MRRNDEAVDLLVAVIGEREDRPVRSGLACAHLDAANDAVRPWRRRHLDAVAVGVLKIDRVGQIDGGGVGADVDGFDRMRCRNAKQRGDAGGQDRANGKGAERPCAQACGAQKCQKTPPRPAAGAVCATTITVPPNDFVPGFAPNSRPPVLRPKPSLAPLTVMAILVSRAPTGGKNIPVYFQRVRTSLQSWLPGFLRFRARQIGLRHDVTSGPPAVNFDREEMAHARGR